MTERLYKVGKAVPSWKDGSAQTITFIITEDCNLRCKYCYITHKASDKKMNFKTAQLFIDYILTEDFKREEAVIIEFIGGEPLIEIELIDQICDYFKLKTFEMDLDWHWNYRISICTNGVNYSDQQVQNFLKKNLGKLSVTITLDGTKEKHDLQRIFPNGEGSYDTIKKNIGLWLTQFSGSTKVTFASDDLRFLKDSIIALWNDGILDISANVVFEDVWKDNDDVIFEEQLKELADYILDNQIFAKHYCSLFDDSIGQFYSDEDLKKTSCGTGKMIAVGPDGNLYPCLRYKDYSLNDKPEWSLGNVDDGIDMEKVRPFMTAISKLQSDDECINCEVASGCSYCQGFNYDDAEIPTNFHRAKYICKMHKARVRANNYYFAKLFNKFGISKGSSGRESKRMYFLLSDDYVNYCQNENKSKHNHYMSHETILDGLKYTSQNFYEPIFVHSKNKFNFKNLEEYNEYNILHIVPAEFSQEAKNLKNYMLVFDRNNIDSTIDVSFNCMLNIDMMDICNMYTYVKKILTISDRVNINILNMGSDFDSKEYENQLLKIKYLLVEIYNENELFKEINIITDLYFLNNHNNCKAGDRSFTYAPNGEIYVCSGFYNSNKDNSIGDIKNGINRLKKPELYRTKHSGLCSLCDTYQCIDCVYLNVTKTNEINVSPSYQCRKSFIEREVSRLLQLELGNGITGRLIEEIAHKEPMGILEENIGDFTGYYVYQK